MAESEWLLQLSKQGADVADLAAKAAKQPGMLAEVFEGLRADRPRIKYGCAKVLRLISEESPAALYPHFDRMVALLESDNKILQWTAINVIGNLAAVDSEARIEKIAARYLKPIRGPVMITAANVMGGAAKIALAKPKLADKIAKEILKVEAARYQTPECRNVALGHSINSLAQFFSHLSKRQAVVNMVRRQLRNPRNATRRKAERFLKRYGLHAA
jgi:hypothetical protein